MKNYLIKNHLLIIIIILIIISTNNLKKDILDSVDYQTWRLCQGLNLAFTETLNKKTAEEVFIQSCSREKLLDYLRITPNSKDIVR